MERTHIQRQHCTYLVATHTPPHRATLHLNYKPPCAALSSSTTYVIAAHSSHGRSDTLMVHIHPTYSISCLCIVLIYAAPVLFSLHAALLYT